MHMPSIGLRAAFAAALGLAAATPHPALAGASLLISPIDPVIEGGRGAAALWLENRGDAPAVMQIRLFRWTQDNGEDRYADQAEIVASPPIVQIPAGGRQLVRLTSAPAQRPAGESAYRVIVDEIPAAPTPAEGGAPSGTARGVRFQMRYSIPLFVYGGAMRVTPQQRAATLAGLRCAVVVQGDARTLRITNEGPLHARLVEVRFDERAGAVPLGQGLFGYVLPGQTISRPLPAGASGTAPLSMAGTGNERVVPPGCAGS